LAGRFTVSGRELEKVVSRIEQEKLRNNHENDQEDNLEPPDVPEISTGVTRREPEQINRQVGIKHYKKASIQLIRYKESLHQVSNMLMADWITQIVEVESPIHIDEVARRIIECAGVKRIGNRIKKKVQSGINNAVIGKHVIKREDFLWKPPGDKISLRSRGNLPSSSKRLDLIAPQEIGLAIKYVVKICYGIDRDSIPSEASQLLGFQRTTENMSDQIERVLQSMIVRGKLIVVDNIVKLPD